MEKKSCPGCGGMYTPVTGGGLRAHGPVDNRCSQQAPIATAPCDDENCCDPEPMTDTDAWDNPGRPHDWRDGVHPAEDWQAQASAAAKRHVALAEDAANAYGSAGGADLADPFEDPTPVGPQLNVSGQPKPEYEWRGKQNLGYLVKLPWTGDYLRYGNGNAKGLTRATTFNKELSNGKSLNDWRARNVLIGATRRPDVVDRANGMTHEANRNDLMKLVAELETAAGAKVSADIGTQLHAFTELMDAGLKAPCEAPPRYQDQLTLYVTTLAEAGFEMVPGLIERTTMIREYGGVVGTFDRIVYHRPTNTYMIADLKTGKTADYLVEETETQEWVYAHGVNQNGVYDWNTNTWQPPRSYGDSIETGPWEIPEVSETHGLIIWMPVQGPHAGTVQLLRADLEAGAAHARRCHDARTRPKRKPVAWDGPKPVAELPDWDKLFSEVTSEADARALWDRASAAGVVGAELDGLVAIAMQRLEPPF